jgi:lysophospholipase L1-like esterase
MRVFASLAILGLFLCVGCSILENPPRLQSENYTDVVRVACVGDSITYGFGVENRETNSYPAVLGSLLGPKFETKNFGVSGATLLKKGDHPYWNTDAFKEVDKYEPDSVVIKLGTNDSKPQNWEHGADFEADLRAMIDHFKALPSHPSIWLCLPVPVYQTQWGINDAVVKGEIIPKIQKVAKERKLPVINLYSALKKKPEMFPDKVHPNAAGARVIAETVYGAFLGNPISK